MIIKHWYSKYIKLASTDPSDWDTNCHIELWYRECNNDTAITSSLHRLTEQIETQAIIELQYRKFIYTNKSTQRNMIAVDK